MGEKKKKKKENKKYTVQENLWNQCMLPEASAWPHSCNLYTLYEDWLHILLIPVSFEKPKGEIIV